MIAKNNKKLIVSGILFIIATVCYSLYQILLHSFMKGFCGAEVVAIAWENITFTTICAIIFVFYCFVLHKTKVEKKIYLLGCGAYALLNIYFILSTDGRFDFYVMSDILFLVITIFMIIVRTIKLNRVSIIGIILFIIYALTQFIAVINEILNSFYIGGIIWLVFCVYLIAEISAFVNLWLVECGDSISTKSQTNLIKTPKENDLVSLKQLLDNGTISEDEYNKKKLETLNKL